MEYRINKKTEEKISILGFGCMRFPKSFGKVDFNKTEQLILKAIEEGINYFDTAYIYGSSEEVLGKILTKNNLRNKVFIATKLPLILIKKREDFDKFFNKSLQRLQTDHIDYYLMHMLTDLKQWESLVKLGIIEWIEEKKNLGKIKQIGFSFHGSNSEFLKILDTYDWEFCQIQYNYANEFYQAGVTGLKKAYEKGIPVIVMEPLLGGKLANALPKEAINIFEKQNKNISPAAWALKWIWNQKEVTTLLSGMSSLNDLDDNLNAAKGSKIDMFKDKEIEMFKHISKVFNDTYKIKCTGCNYCMPCPFGVNIPGCFAAYNSYHAISKITGISQYTTTTLNSTKYSGASKCTKCGVCETKCPQKIEIRNSLEKVNKKLEPFWYKAGIKLFRNFQKKQK